MECLGAFGLAHPLGSSTLRPFQPSGLLNVQPFLPRATHICLPRHALARPPPHPPTHPPLPSRPPQITDAGLQESRRFLPAMAGALLLVYLLLVKLLYR